MSAAPASSPVNGERLFAPERRSILLALMSIVAIASYNNLSATAALPDIGDDLGGISLLPFVITISLLTSAVAILASGPVVDGFGARQTFRIAAVGFLATSLLVAASPTMTLLLVARAAQGIFSGMIMTVAMASIGLAIPEKLRPRAFALTSSVWGVVGVAGPALAALLVATVGWRGIFVVNVPVTALAAIIGWNRIPARPDGAERQAFDRVGLALIAVLTTGALALASAQLSIIAVAGVVVVTTTTVYVWWAGRIPDPVVRIPHVLDPRYRVVHLTSMAVLAGGVGADAFLPLYLRTVRGQSASIAAFGVLFLTIGWTGSAYVASRLQDRWAGEWVALLGSLIATSAAFATALAIAVDAPLVLVYGVFVWFGSGVGMVTSTGSALLQSRTRVTEMGRLNGAHQFLRTIALTFGIAVVGAVTLAIVDRRTGDVEIVRKVLGGETVATSADVLDAIGDGYTIAILIVAAAVTASIPGAIRLVRTRNQPLVSAT